MFKTFTYTFGLTVSLLLLVVVLFAFLHEANTASRTATNYIVTLYSQDGKPIRVWHAVSSSKSYGILCFCDEHGQYFEVTGTVVLEQLKNEQQ